MADIIIKGMEMPKDNATSIIIFSNGKVSLAHDKKYAEYAEAVPLPEGHGRLGDLDALDKFLAEKEKEAETSEFYLGESWYNTFRQILRTRQTIVPAEERDVTAIRKELLAAVQLLRNECKNRDPNKDCGSDRCPIWGWCDKLTNENGGCASPCFWPDPEEGNSKDGI